jgi:2Fe-2S ferredoxin
MQSRSRATVQFRVLPDDRIVEASHGESILNSLLRHKIPLDHSCGGSGTCGTCRVLVVSGIEKLDAPNEVEAELSQDRRFEEHERLSCQTEAREGIVILRPVQGET